MQTFSKTKVSFLFFFKHAYTHTTNLLNNWESLKACVTGWVNLQLKLLIHRWLGCRPKLLQQSGVDYVFAQAILEVNFLTYLWAALFLQVIFGHRKFFFCWKCDSWRAKWVYLLKILIIINATDNYFTFSEKPLFMSGRTIPVSVQKYFMEGIIILKPFICLQFKSIITIDSFSPLFLGMQDLICRF